MGKIKIQGFVNKLNLWIERINLKADRTLKLKLLEVPLDTFWLAIRSEYPAISEMAVNVLLPFQCSAHSKEITEKNRHVNKAFCGVPPHWNINVRRYLNNELRHRWVGRVGEDDVALFTWPPRPPDLTPCDFFLWGYIKDRVYVPPLPRTLVELRERIDAVVMTIDRMMLQNVWNELDYGLDVCRVTQEAHIEHL
ncbi:hypothetical protein B7P43_G02048 [Cryptotermes secundus]|uniref:Uncharacterized protein n=1 Tax=Cryptotermes secundus TaxID=105785 RepID=A0A2J7RLV3_9NEOP|nr:hypothetical protein B7P43_G02048 [Cryptotermes secundus]